MNRFRRLSEAGLLSALHREAFVEGWSETACQDILSMPGVVCWISETGSSPSGFLVIRQAADEGEVITTGVLPPYRRTGLASDLFDHALDDLEGCERLFLEVSARNQAAQGLYRKLGFLQVGRRKAYYSDGDDALVLAR